MSFTPGAPLRRSFKEDREERRRRKQAKQRSRIIAIAASVLVLGVVGWAIYAQASIAAFISSLKHPPQKAVVAVHTVATYRPYKLPLKLATLTTPTPTPAATPTPALSPTPAPTSTPKPAKTPKPKVLAAVTKPKPPLSLLANTFLTPPTPAPVATPLPTPVPAMPTPSAEVYAPQIVVDARFTSRVQPEYPEIAREQNISGTAVVLVTVGPKGNVLSQRLEKSAGHPLLDQAALNAAARSSFVPPKIDGKPATETYRIVYAFTP